MPTLKDLIEQRVMNGWAYMTFAQMPLESARNAPTNRYIGSILCPVFKLPGKVFMIVGRADRNTTICLKNRICKT